MGAATAMAIGGAASLAGGLMGADAMKSGMQANKDALDYARQQYEGIKIPDIKEQELNLSLPELKYLQEYMESAQNLGPSEMQSISTDPRLMQAQLNALQSLTQIGESGGMTDIEKSQLNAIRRNVAQEDKARQESILQNMAQRGLGGSGVELAARLSSSQASADRASQESDRQAAIAQQRALEAIAQSGTLGGQMRGQEFGEKSAIAQAKDAIARFNLQNSQEIGRRNIERENAMQAAKQSMLEAQNAIKNQQQQHNKGLLQQQFGNQMSLAAGKAGQSQAAGAAALQGGQMMGQIYGGMGQGIAQTAGAFMNAGATKPTSTGGGGGFIADPSSQLTGSSTLKGPSGYFKSP